MLKLPLGTDDSYLILAPRWADLGLAWQIGLLALLIVVPLALIFWLYRYELRLVAPLQAGGLVLLRISILFILWTTIALQPRLAKISVEETPGRVRVAVDLSSSMAVTDKEQSRSRRAI